MNFLKPWGLDSTECCLQSTASGALTWYKIMNSVIFQSNLLLMLVMFNEECHNRHHWCSEKAK